MGSILGMVFLLGSGYGLATGQTPEVAEQDKEALAELDTRFIQALESEDLETMMALYADEAVAFLPDGNHYSKLLIRQSYAQWFLGAKETNISVRKAQYSSEGNLGWSNLEFDFRATFEGGEQLDLLGRTTGVFRKVDGNWRYILNHTSLVPRPRGESP